MSEETLKIEITEDAQPDSPENSAPAPVAEENAKPSSVSPGSDQGSFQVSDRRFWAQDADAVDRAAPPAQRHPSYIEELKARTEAAENKLREKLSQLDADNEAYRVRLRREMENRAEQQTRQTLEGFLEVVDNLERALDAAQASDDASALQEGVKLNLQLFLDKLRAAGIESLEMQGQPFDPHLAEAVGSIPVDSPEQDQTVIEVVQKGYLTNGQLLRPARVRIGQYEPGVQD